MAGEVLKIICESGNAFLDNGIPRDEAKVEESKRRENST